MIFTPPHPDPPPGAKGPAVIDPAPYVVEWKIRAGRWAGHWAWCVIGPSRRECYVMVRKGGARPRVRP